MYDRGVLAVRTTRPSTLFTVGRDPHFSVVFQLRAFSDSVTMMEVFFLLVLQLCVIVQLGVSCSFVCGTIVLNFLPIQSSEGLRPHHGIGVARYANTAR